MSPGKCALFKIRICKCKWKKKSLWSPNQQLNTKLENVKNAEKPSTDVGDSFSIWKHLDTAASVTVICLARCLCASAASQVCFVVGKYLKASVCVTPWCSKVAHLPLFSRRTSVNCFSWSSLVIFIGKSQFEHMDINSGILNQKLEIRSLLDER